VEDEIVVEPEPEPEPEREPEEAGMASAGSDAAEQGGAAPPVDAGSAEPAGRRPARPHGVPPDTPIWDKRHHRYVLWHSKSGRWLEHAESGWQPIDGEGG